MDSERGKIRNDLDGRLRLSLQALETELTKAREFEKAEVVVAFREGLGTLPAVELAGSEPKTSATITLATITPFDGTTLGDGKESPVPPRSVS